MAELSLYEIARALLSFLTDNSLAIFVSAMVAVVVYTFFDTRRMTRTVTQRALAAQYRKPRDFAQTRPLRLDPSAVEKLRLVLEEENQGFSFVRKSRPIDEAEPKVFYYMDEKTVENLYFQLFPEVVPKQITQTRSGEIEKGVHGETPIVGGKYERSLSEETVTEYEVRQRPTMMYSRVERVLNSQEKITYGLEDFEIHDELIDDFKNQCEEMKTDFKFQIPVELQSKWTSDRKKEHATKYVEFLSSVSGYVQVQAKFSVTQPSLNECLLSFVHPLSQYLPPTERKVMIQVSCAKNCLTPSGSNLFKQGSIVNLTCFGKAVGLNANSRTLNIVPIAVY